jgi:phosphoglycerate dehydrogenase-like enzyme
VKIVRVARTARDRIHGVDELPELLPAADVLIVLAPLTRSTRGLVDAQALKLLPDGALVVNAGRGAVIDTDALVVEVKAKRLRAALDVVDPEPLPADHPLWKLRGALISPHVSGDSARADEAAARMMGEQLRRLAWGAPLMNVVERGG